MSERSGVVWIKIDKMRALWRRDARHHHAVGDERHLAGADPYR
jgi:hypothetical protein